MESLNLRPPNARMTPIGDKSEMQPNGDTPASGGAGMSTNSGYSGKYPMHEEQARRKAAKEDAASVARPEDMTPEALFDLIREYRNAPSNTASAMTTEQWAKAWQDEWQRANRAEAELEELREANRLRDEQRAVRG